MYVHIKYFVILSFLINAFVIKAQNINMDQTIDYLNAEFGGKCILDTKKNDLVFNFYENNTLIRTDIIGFDQVNSDMITYIDEEKAFMITCLDNEKCVFRKLYKEKIKRFYGRVNIPFTPDEKSKTGIINALKHLVMLTQDDNYQNDKPFE